MDRKKLIDKIKLFKENIKKKYKLDRIIFFGSRVSGKSNKDSDVDLIVVSKNFEGVKSFKRSPDLFLEWHLNSKINYPVDFICYTPEEFNKLKKQITIVREAVETGIEI